MTAFSLMTWNVRYFGHGLGGLRTTEGWIRLAARALARLDALPDVVALQEVETTSLRGGLSAGPQLDRFLDHLHAALAERGVTEGYRGLHFAAHRYGFRRSPALYTTGLAVLVRDGIAVEGTDTHEITHVPTSSLRRLKQRRIVAQVRVRKSVGPALDLFNTHLSLPAFLEVGPHRVHERLGHGSNQVHEARRVIDFVNAKKGDHAVVLGDLNAAPGTPVYQAFTDGGLVDAHHVLEGDAFSRHASARFFSWLLHIDHVFSTPSVTWDDFRAHRIDERGPFLGLSDHSPKIGHLRLT